MTDLEKGSLPNFKPAVAFFLALQTDHRGLFRRFLAQLDQQTGLIGLELDDRLAARLVDWPDRFRIEMQRIQGILAFFQAGFG